MSFMKVLMATRVGRAMCYCAEKITLDVRSLLQGFIFLLIRERKMTSHFFIFFIFFFYESLYMMHTGHTITTQLIPVCALLNTTTSI